MLVALFGVNNDDYYRWSFIMPIRIVHTKHYKSPLKFRWTTLSFFTIIRFSFWYI